MDVDALPATVHEYPLPGLFTLGSTVSAVLTAVCYAVAGHVMTLRCGVLTLVLAGFAALFWLEPFLDEYA